MLVQPVEFLRLHRDSPVLVRTGHGTLVMDHQTPSASLQIDQMSASLALAYLAVEAVTPTNWNYLNWQVFLSSFILKWVFHVVASLLQIRSASDAAQTLSWHSLAVVRGSYGPEDSINDVAEIKFDRPVPIKVCELTFFPHILLLDSHQVCINRKTLDILSGFGIKVERPIMATEVFFLLKARMEPLSTSQLACLVSMERITSVASCLTFSIASESAFCYLRINSQFYVCFFHLILSIPSNSEVQQSSLSAIGNQARKSIMSITSSIVRCTSDLLCAARSLPIHHSLPIICKSHVVSYLLPFVVANIGVVAESDPKVNPRFFQLNISKFFFNQKSSIVECCTNPGAHPSFTTPCFRTLLGRHSVV